MSEYNQGETSRLEETRMDERREVAARDEVTPSQWPPDETVPLPDPTISMVELSGGYVMAVLSQQQDPDGPNLAAQVKVRTIMAADAAGLGPHVATTLVSEFGMTPEEAEALVPAGLEAREATGEQTERERMQEARRQAQRQEGYDPNAPTMRGQTQTQDQDPNRQYQPQPEERPRDEHGRFV